ncbi:hypothetical protein M8J76_004791 [Diaphorina citri]|nr:hypothetical protein M8J76_004791 [Diaphorina citri]
MLAQARSSCDASPTSATPSNITLDLIHQLFTLFKEQVIGELNTIKAQLTVQGEYIDRLETYSRRNCILLHGVPEGEAKTEEQCLTAATGIFRTKLALNIAPPAIDRAHRLGPPRSGDTRPRPIIVKFKAYFDKRAVYTSKKLLKGQPLSISESLTKTRLSLMKRARDHFSMSRVWTSDGKVIVKVEGREHLCTVTTSRELDALIAAHPAPHTDTRPPLAHVNTRRGPAHVTSS